MFTVLKKLNSVTGILVKPNPHYNLLMFTFAVNLSNLSIVFNNHNVS